MDDWHGTTAMLVINQLPADQWYSGIGDNTLAATNLDNERSYENEIIIMSATVVF